jgi:predicted RNA-binding protein with RPS1 domain
MNLREHKLQYEQEIDEYQKNLELSIRKIEDVETELANLQEEKESNQKLLNDIINSTKEDFEKEIEILKTQYVELQERCS